MNTAEELKIKSGLRNYILGTINVENLDDSDNLFESGIVNSLFAVQLMTYVEKTFEVEVGMDDLDMENFKSIDAITAFVIRKRTAILS